MKLDIIVSKGYDGINAKIPSLQDCESWAHTEDEALEKITELARFIMKLSPQSKIVVDQRAKEGDVKIFSMIFSK